MEIKPTRVINCKGKKYELCEPTFDVYSLAMQKYITGTGELNLVGAGKIIFDACYMGSDLDELQSNVPLYANLCLQAASVIEFIDAEIKKN